MTGKEIKLQQTPPSRIPIQQNSPQLTPDYLDSIINNPNEHAQVRKQATAMKANLFPQASEAVNPPEVTETEKPIIKPKQIKKKQVQEELSEDDFIIPQVPTALIEAEEVIPQFPKKTQTPAEETPVIKEIKPLEIKAAESKDFNSFLSEFKNNLFTDEFFILSTPGTKIQLRSMTVSEYKFLTKQFDIYQKSISVLDRSNPELAREIDIRESVLTNAIDTVLQRCITNNVKVYDLLLYDWIYAIVALRSISRGTDKNLRITCSNRECKSSISLGILDAMQKIEDSKSKFILNPISTITLNENTSLYLGIPTRGDLVEAQTYFIEDVDANLGFVNTAMYIRAYIKNKTEANLLSTKQRFELINALPYDTIKDVKDAVNKNLNEFYNCFGEIKCEKCKGTTSIDVSDFILFFYDF